MEFLKIHTGRPQSLDNLVGFMSRAIDTFNVSQEQPDFPSHHLPSMIRNLTNVLLTAPQELNVHDLVVKVFRVGLHFKLL